jgi:hypothetical protein
MALYPASISNHFHSPLRHDADNSAAKSLLTPEKFLDEELGQPVKPFIYMTEMGVGWVI